MRYTLELRRYGCDKWRALSVSAKAPFTRFEVDCHRHQWAADNQENPGCVDARILQDGEPWATFPSNAAINSGVEL